MTTDVMIEIQVTDPGGERWTLTQHHGFEEPVDECDVEEWKRYVIRSGCPRGEIVREMRHEA
jgi:hypothetical protein